MTYKIGNIIFKTQYYQDRKYLDSVHVFKWHRNLNIEAIAYRCKILMVRSKCCIKLYIHFRMGVRYTNSAGYGILCQCSIV